MGTLYTEASGGRKTDTGEGNTYQKLEQQGAVTDM